MPQQDLVPRGPDAPTYGATPQVAPEALPGVRATVNMPPAAAGGGENVAREFGAAGDLADTVSKIAEQSQENADRKTLFDYATQAGLKRNELHMKAEATHGEAVNGLPEAIRDEYTKYTDELASKLPARLQGRFAHIAGTNLVHLDGAVQMHVARENDQNEQQTYSTAIQTQQNTARLNWKTWDAPDKDNAVDFAAAGAQQAVINFGNSRTMKRELIDAHVAKVTAQTYAGVVEAMLDNDQELTAKQAFEKYSKAGYFDGDANLKDRLTREVEGGSIRVQSDKAVSDAWDWAAHSRNDGRVKPDWEPTFKTEKQALDAVNTMTEGQDQRVIDEARKRAIAKYHEERNSLKESQDSDFQNAADQIRKAIEGQPRGNEISGTPSILHPSDAVQNEVWTRLPEEAKEHLERYFTRLTAPEKDKTDERTLTKFYSHSQDDFNQMSPADMFRFRTGFTQDGVNYGGLSDADYKDALKYWSAARKKEDAAQFKFMKADEDRIFKMMQDSGLGGISGHDTMATIEKNDTKRKAWESFRKDAMDALESRFQDKKKNADPKERDEVVRDLIIDKTVHQKQSGFANWLLDNIPGYRGKWDAMGGSIDITPDERKRATALVERAGKDVTDAKLQMLARAARGGASGRLLAKLAGE